MPHPVQFEPSWENVPGSAPAQHVRPLQGAELMHDCADRLNNGLAQVCMGVTFKTCLSNNELRARAYEAMGRMRFVIPILACAIRADPSDPFASSFVYTDVRDQADLQAWINATLSVRYGPVDADAFIAEMNAFRLPYVHPDGHEQPSHFYLLVDNSSKAGSGEDQVHGLFMHGPHTLMDAFPTLRCLNALLDWIANPPAESLAQLPWGEEWKSLPVPPIAATGGIRDDWDTEGVKLMEELTEMIRHPIPTHSLLPPRPSVIDPGKTTRMHVRLNRETSARIVRATKSLGFTPSALFDASVCLATFKKNPVKPEDAPTAHFTLDPTVIAQDRYLVPPHNGLSHFIAGLCLVSLRIPYISIPFSSPPCDQLVAVMAQLRSQLDHYLRNANLPHVMPAQLVYHPPRMAKDISNPNVSITSNMGNINSLVKDKVKDGEGKVIEVVDMAFGHRLHWQRLMLHCWSHNGEMRLQIQASDIWDEPFLRSYLNDVQAFMLSILETTGKADAPRRVTTTGEPTSGGDNHSPFDGDRFTRTSHHTSYPEISLRPTDFAGRIIFISGASSATGRATAVTLARAGAAGLVLAARANHSDDLSEVEGGVYDVVNATDSKPKVLKVAMDLLDDASIASAVSLVRSTFGSIDTLFNIAACIDETVPLTESDLDTWWKPMETNLRGTCAVTRALLPLLKESPSDVKWIVNYSSSLAHYPSPLCSGYAISKFALLRLTEILSIDLASTPSDIMVLAVHPGLVHSPIALRALPSKYHHLLTDSAELPAQSVAWLTKERRTWLTGRYVNCTWDLLELVDRADEVVRGDLLKLKLSLA